MKTVSKQDNKLGYLSQSKGTFQPLEDMATPYLVNIANKTHDSEDLHAIINELAARPRPSNLWPTLTHVARQLPAPNDVESAIQDELACSIRIAPLVEAILEDADLEITETELGKITDKIENHIAAILTVFRCN